MKCWIDIDTLQKYQNGTISTEEKPRLENHIDQCPICQENLMIIEMISEQEQSGAYVDNDHAAALIMSRLDKRLYSRDKISSRFKLLIHKLLPVRRKVISGATAAACMLMVVAGVVAFDRTFGDFYPGGISPVWLQDSNPLMIRICCLSSSLTMNSLTWNPDISLLMIIQIRHSETSQGSFSQRGPDN